MAHCMQEFTVWQRREVGMMLDTVEGEKFSTGTGDNSLSGIESMLDGEEEDRVQQQEQVDQRRRRMEG